MWENQEINQIKTGDDVSLNELYQEVIIEHSRRPRFKFKPEACCFCQEGKNASCGDAITVFCTTKNAEDERQTKLSICFDGVGCSICQASASIMCEALQNVTLAEAKKWIDKAENIYTGKHHVQDLDEDIEALQGVSKFPVRIKCAALAWKTLELLFSENFDSNGKAMAKNTSECKHLFKNTMKKLKVVSTE